MDAEAPSIAQVGTKLRLREQVAVVTGGAKGLGVAITDSLASEGAHVVLAGRDQVVLDAHAASLDATHPDRHTLAVPCDVTDEASVEQLIASSMKHFGRVDILVNAAGMIGPIETPAHEVSPSEFRDVIEVNLLGTFLPCKAVIPHLINQRSGRIVNIAGTAGLRGYRNRVAYSSSKWAVRGLTRTLALELGPFGITVNTVCPNVTHGKRMDTIVREKAKKLNVTPGQVYSNYVSETALGRFIEDVDVAEAVCFLASEGARNITGHDIVVDAGWEV